MKFYSIINNIEALRSRSFIFKEKSDLKNAQNDLLLAIKIDDPI